MVVRVWVCTCTRGRWWRAVWMVKSGELLERRLSPDHERVFLEWTRSLPGHAAVVYEAGPPVIE